MDKVPGDARGRSMAVKYDGPAKSHGPARGGAR
jgi:hypothetical protein